MVPATPSSSCSCQALAGADPCGLASACTGLGLLLGQSWDPWTRGCFSVYTRIAFDIIEARPPTYPLRAIQVVMKPLKPLS